MTDQPNPEELQEQLAQMTQTAQRAMADLQNFKRRTEEERGELQVYANMQLLQAIFPALDNLGRAFDHIPEELADHEWVKGVQSIEENLVKALQSIGLEAVDQTGLPVDPNIHEVLMEGEGPAGEVIQVLEKGFTFKGKTIKAAKVAVGKKTIVFCNKKTLRLFKSESSLFIILNPPTMKTLKFITASLSMTALLVVSSFSGIALADDGFTCGQWTDVPSEDMAILTEVCSFGLMQGMSEDFYGYGQDLSRAAAGTIVSRMVMGSEAYDAIQQDEDVYEDALDDIFTDLPASINSNEWILKAMNYSYNYGIMTGDGGSTPTTFRPLESINIPETFKVFYEAAKEADVLGEDTDENIQYFMDPWYDDLFEELEDQGVLIHLNIEDQTFWLNGNDVYNDFGSDVKREDAAKYLDKMISFDVIDEDALREHTGTELTDDDIWEDVSDWLSFEIDEMGFGTLYPKEATVTEDVLMENPEYGHTVVFEDNGTFFTAFGTSAEFSEETDLDYYPGESIDLSLSDEELTALLEATFGTVYELEDYEFYALDAPEAISFYRSYEEDGKTKLVPSILFPAIGEAHEDMANVLLTGPVLSSFDGTPSENSTAIEDFISNDLDTLEDEVQELLDDYYFMIDWIDFTLSFL